MGWEHHWGFFPFGCIFFVLLFGFLIFRIFNYRRYGGWHHGRHGDWHNGRADAEAILMRRLASGEIDEAEYTRLMEFLKK